MASTSKSAGGRPPKFDEPRRPVTVTLPKRTLSALAALDADRARAIVKLVDAALSSKKNGAKLVCAVFPGSSSPK